jgi:Tol biopolymer transport system component/predicted Ser/Thr protein kinase
MSLNAGSRLGSYEILAPLGAGGMGEVYKAKDTRLDRTVAVKVLPSHLAESAERRERFEREAKAVAALDHPNIVTIYSVEESEGVHFITMEFVKGKTLAELLPKSGYPLSKFLDIAIPLADAVASAHERGIVHRDLKPRNVMVSDDGRVKVLDFGLAKAVAGFMQAKVASELPTAAKTDEGVIVGTVSYMSPEQAEGKTVDHRSDIFSLGIILYEMVTGRHPFQGDTTASILSSILRDTPTSATEINPKIPRDLGKIIKRCMEKEPRRRYQTAIDVFNELEGLKQDVNSGEVYEGAPPPHHTKRKSGLIVAAAAVLALALAGTLTFILRQPDERVLRLTNPIQVTSAIGVENYPTLSPEGQRLAYESNQSGNYDIWAVQLGGAEPVNLTADYEGSDRYPRWSPDGSQIAFRSDRDDGASLAGVGDVFVMSALGGRPRRVASALHNNFQWSVDGNELACLLRDGKGYFVELVTLSNRETRRIPFPALKDLGCMDLSWSPDGRLFAYVAAPGTAVDITQVWALSSLDGKPTPVTDGRTLDWSPTWSLDDHDLYFVSNRGGSMDLWQQRISENGKPMGEPQRVTTGLVIRNIVFSRDGSKLAYSRYRRVANIWRIPILGDRLATWADSQQLTFDEAHVEGLDLSPDGKRLVFSSDRSGNKDLWLMPSEGGEMEQLTTDPFPDWMPSWSPNGEEIAFHTIRSGNRDIWVIPVEGGPARQLTHHPSTDWLPTWSPDGSEIAFVSARSGQLSIWVAPVDGGEPRHVTHDLENVEFPVYSPDGKWILAASENRRGPLWRIPLERGKAEPITEADNSYAAWSPDGMTVYFSRDGDYWARSLTDATEARLTDFSGRRGGLDALMTTDGQYIYFQWREDIGDIWVMDVVYE